MYTLFRVLQYILIKALTVCLVSKLYCSHVSPKTPKRAKLYLLCSSLLELLFFSCQSRQGLLFLCPALCPLRRPANLINTVADIPESWEHVTFYKRQSDVTSRQMFKSIS